MTNFTNEQTMLLILLRRALWDESPEAPAGADWEAVDRMAREQGVTSLVYDGARQMNTDIPTEILGKWRQKMLHGVVHNERLLTAQTELLTRLEQAGIPAVILKGSSVARYYPQPALRVLGDTDVLVSREHVEPAKQILTELGYRMHESDHGFHIGFRSEKAYVELHYGVTDFPDSPGGEAAARIAAGFLDERSFGNIDHHPFPVLTEENQGLSLLLHMVRHMFDQSIGLRQLCDWAVYAAGQDRQVLTGKLLPMLESCGLLEYAKTATAVCVHYLGLQDWHLGWCADVREDLCREFMHEVFRGGNMGQADREGMGSLFTERSHMGTEISAWKALLLRLTKRVYEQFPWVKRCKPLLPAFWIWLPARYWIRSVFGLRPRKKPNRVIHNALQTRYLYDRLKLFELDGSTRP